MALQLICRDELLVTRVAVEYFMDLQRRSDGEVWKFRNVERRAAGPQSAMVNGTLSVFIRLTASDRKAIKVLKSFNPLSASEHRCNNCTFTSSPAYCYNGIC